MNIKKNLHYQNKHGQQLKDFMIKEYPELWQAACMWSGIKYTVRAGKKAGESYEKDMGKVNDYVGELVETDNMNDKDEIINQINRIADLFEEFKG